jgi:hypothetical protein
MEPNFNRLFELTQQCYNNADNMNHLHFSGMIEEIVLFIPLLGPPITPIL